MLSPLSHSLETGVTIQLVITVWGNSVDTHQNDRARSAGVRAATPPPYYIPPIHETLRFADPEAFNRNSNIQTKAETERETISGSPLAIDAQLAQTMPQSLQNGVYSVSKGATGFGSVVSNLEEMLLDAKLLPSVSDHRGPVLFL